VSARAKPQPTPAQEAPADLRQALALREATIRDLEEEMEKVKGDNVTLSATVQKLKTKAAAPPPSPPPSPPPATTATPTASTATPAPSPPARTLWRLLWH